MAYTLGDIGNVPGQAYDFLNRQAGRFVNLTKPGADDGDYTTRSAAIARQKRLADMLSQMGEQEQAVSTAGGITAPMSGMGPLVRGLTSFGGAYLSGKASADEAAATIAEKAAIQGRFADIFKKGNLVEQGAQLADDAEGIPQYAANTQVGRGKYILTPEDQQRRLIALVGEHQGAAGQANLYSNLINEERTRADAETRRAAADTRETQRYETGQERLDRAEAARQAQQKIDNEYRTERATLADEIAIGEAVAKRQAYRDSVAIREVTAAGPSKAFTVTGADGRTRNFFGTNVEARNIALAGEKVVEGGILPKPVPTRAADELMNKAAVYDKAKGLKNDFRPEFTNLGVAGFGGDQVLALKKTYGDNDPAVQWWTSYNEKAGQIRNKLYGASLTPNEIAEWLKIAVNPNMNATTIQANLERQRQLEENAMFRSVGSLKGSGYSEESISGAAGYPSTEFKFNKPQAVLPDKPVDNSEANKRARLAAAKARLDAGAP